MKPEPKDRYAGHEKKEWYFAGARHDIISELPPSNKAKILEVVCGNGDTGFFALKAGKCGYYCGNEKRGFGFFQLSKCVSLQRNSHAPKRRMGTRRKWYHGLHSLALVYAQILQKNV
jgi:hypothetical protein